MISDERLNGTHEFMFLSVSLNCVPGEEHVSPRRVLWKVFESSCIFEEFQTSKSSLHYPRNSWVHELELYIFPLEQRVRAWSLVCSRVQVFSEQNSGTPHAKQLFPRSSSLDNPWTHEFKGNGTREFQRVSTLESMSWFRAVWVTWMSPERITSALRL